MSIEEVYSFRGGQTVVEEKGLRGEVREIVERLDQMGDEEAGRVAADHGWNREEQVVRDFNWRYDAYKDGIAIEFERGQQVKARWNWIKFQLGYEGVPESKVDAGVLLITQDRGHAAVSRCKTELESGVFNNVLNLTVPMVITEFQD